MAARQAAGRCTSSVCQLVLRSAASPARLLPDLGAPSTAAAGHPLSCLAGAGGIPSPPSSQHQALTLWRGLCGSAGPPLGSGCRRHPIVWQSRRHAASNASEFDLIEVDIQMARVDMYYSGGFTVNNIQMPGPVFLCGRLSLLWRAPASVEALSPADLPLISLIKPAPDFLVIGTGATFKPVSRELQEYLRERAISVEVLDTVNAASTFNILNQESRNVAACMFPL
mmetsp:Transcript_15906/g.40697  ORF Transcript_15906/g.40697 Transcript_15906/m.40697 type:complete len:226 (-) Transcript_15906:122-799(-)|eukprot:jgi/Tetstr1/444340/TSEL_032231.t1